ncbi:unnamed protein product [Rotaria sordida]|uniref:Lysosome membrane protein 2 n=1 Tax=Rotaria sordida TaxID=392033 RepID=A0A818NCC6_9BILA|nr:unnamed protein product [Rotaria sordida]CAF0836899.1 unnamed protein product [Rotaria sordida]CAF0837900.1 unnamed protein product [Rotaria sordida]CAF0883160.1 unnamed protein product [Rotaria sordida]CAF1030092.1 unnamed protein product [Rotaria sordida]
MPSLRCISCISILALILSCVFVIIGIIGIVAGPNILQKQIYNSLPLKVDSDQLDSWITPPVPVYLQFWLWECVNVIDFIQGGKPMLVERGPFTYLENRTKSGVYFNENYTVTYRQPISYTFLRNMSVDDEQVQITMINTPIVTIISLVRNQSNLTQEILNFFKNVYNESLFVKHTVREWIWGYEDRLLKAAKSIPILKDLVPDDHFGYFYGQNGTDDGLYTVFTGQKDINLLNTINKWNGLSYLPYWKNLWGNQINGTDGSWFHPLINKDLPSERLYMYSTDICRSVYATFEHHSSVLNIPTETFSIPSEVFLNATLNPDNIAFGTYDSGVLDVSACRQGAPIFISLPHLLYAADRYIKSVDGIAPDPSVHRTVLEVEPHTGLVLNAQKRLQINTFIQPDPLIDDLKMISEVILPTIWINESTTIDQKSADDLNNQVLRYFTIIRWVSIVLIPIGVVIFVITIACFARRRSQKATTFVPIINTGSNNSIASENDY